MTTPAPMSWRIGTCPVCGQWGPIASYPLGVMCEDCGDEVELARMIERDFQTKPKSPQVNWKREGF